MSLVYDFVKPLKIWAYLDNFFFIVSNWGTKGKMQKKCQLVYQHFSFGPPLETLKKKVVEMSSNFERLHEIINQAHPESFIILSWKMPKRVNCRHPYLRKLFPIVIFIIAAWWTSIWGFSQWLCMVFACHEHRGQTALDWRSTVGQKKSPIFNYCGAKRQIW